jgi:hypothetical protein
MVWAFILAVVSRQNRQTSWLTLRAHRTRNAHREQERVTGELR